MDSQQQEGSSMARKKNHQASAPPSTAGSSSPPSSLAGAVVSSRDKKKRANRARHRLLSIQYDVEHYLKPLLLANDTIGNSSSSSSGGGGSKDEEQTTLRRRRRRRRLVLVANERCGTWYAIPFFRDNINRASSSSASHFCHFKSTDGHVHLFSLKRLNLSFLKTLAAISSSDDTINNNNNNDDDDESVVWVLDASNKKEMPDSFSRTIPIWACVLNRIAEVYRKELDLPSLFEESDLHLFVPKWIIPESEQSTMESVISIRVQELHQSQAIVDIPGFLQLMTKPLRPYWITPQHSELPSTMMTVDDPCGMSCRPIVCCNASNNRLDKTSSNSRIVWREDGQFWYTPGAADDQESWARHLTAQLFWENCRRHRPGGNDPKPSRPFSSSMTEEEVDDWIDQAVQTAKKKSQNDKQFKGQEVEEDHEQYYDWIGELNLAIGTRRAGRPPQCWKRFDAILNVTNTEYDDMTLGSSTNNNDNFNNTDNKEKFYLQLPVEEGKRDKQELERWMAVGIVFCINHARQGRRILIHCAQGRDRSVAVAMAVVQLVCHLKYPLQWNWSVLEDSINDVLLAASTWNAAVDVNERGGETCSTINLQSGLAPSLVTALLDRDGRNWLLNILRGKLKKSKGESLASKESLRVVLHLIRQDREKAEPTRSTMQKLNRFFMSDAYKTNQTQLHIYTP